MRPTFMQRPDVQKTVEVPLLPFFDQVWMPVVVQRQVLGWCDPDSAEVQFLDKVTLPVVMQDMFSGLDVQKTVDVPQLQFLTVLAEFGCLPLGGVQGCSCGVQTLLPAPGKQRVSIAIAAKHHFWQLLSAGELTSNVRYEAWSMGLWRCLLGDSSQEADFSRGWGVSHLNTRIRCIHHGIWKNTCHK